MIDPFLHQLNKVSMNVVHLPENLATGEQTISFQGSTGFKVTQSAMMDTHALSIYTNPLNLYVLTCRAVSISFLGPLSL